MRLVFVLGGRVFFRFVDGAVRELHDRGHEIYVLTPNGANTALERCVEDCPAVRVTEYRDSRYRWRRPLTALRHLRAYRHWLEPERRWSDFLRRRWATTSFGFPRTLRGVVRLLGHERFDRWLGRLPRSWFESPERAIAPDPSVTRSLVDLAPALVVCTPFVYPSPRRHTTEVEYLKAASRLGIPTAVVVASWDNLTMKGAFYVRPDRVLVWNEIQRQEARDLHEFPAQQVVVTGAPIFDSWFAGRFELPREEFLAEAGLADASDYVLYVESSGASGDEWRTIHDLAEALDQAAADPGLRVMVRRHPSRRDPWPPLEHPRLRLFPDASAVPDTEESRRRLFNSIHHSRAVVGINTTVFLEAAILDRPTVALLDPEKDHFQAGLVHFRYLLDAGYLELAHDAAQVAARILAIRDGEDAGRAPRRAFVASFIRPLGLGRPAAAILAQALLDGIAERSP